MTSDPWKTINYTATTDGSAAGSFSIDTGAASFMLVGKAFIVHDFSGARIGCALLSSGGNAVLMASSFVPYVGYDGTLDVGGTVGPMTTDESTFVDPSVAVASMSATVILPKSPLRNERYSA